MLMIDPNYYQINQELTKTIQDSGQISNINNYSNKLLRVLLLWKNYTKEQVPENNKVTIERAIEYIVESKKDPISKDVIYKICNIINRIKNNELEDLQSWLLTPKIIKKGYIVKVHFIITLLTEKSIFYLYQSSKEICDKYNIKVLAKVT